MREQLRSYVELLFAGNADCEDMKQEILQNTLERYDDLIGQGKSPEAAYRLAISGIGDVSELLGQDAPSESPASESRPVQRQSRPHGSRVLRAIAIMLYILSAIPLLVLEAMGMEEIGLCGTLAIAAVATAMLILAGNPRRRAAQPQKAEDSLFKAISSLLRVVCLVAYFIVSFTTGAWYITWLIFPIMAAIEGAVRAFFDLTHSSALIRLTISALIVLVLIGLLVAGIAADGFSVDLGGLGSGTLSGGTACDSKLFDAADIQEIVILWVSGDVRIRGDSGNTVEYATANSSSNLDTVYKLENGRLSIGFTNKTMLFGNTKSKDLTLSLPADWSGRLLKVEAVSADVTVSDLFALEKLKVESVSGRVTADGIAAQTLDAETVSGDLTLSGSFQNVKIEGVSARCTLTAQTCPVSVALDTVSGDMELYLPEGCGFDLELDGLSNALHTALPYTRNGDHYLCQGTHGLCKIDMDAVSGDLTIRSYTPVL